MSKISLGNGKYCYSGPTCRLHSAAQASAAKSRLDHLISEYLYGKGGINQIMELAPKIEAAQLEYDMTLEGREKLQEEINKCDDDDDEKLVKLKERLRRAQKVAFEVEELEEAEAGRGTKTRELSDEYTYTVPTYKTETGTDNMFPSTFGSKFTGFRPVVEIAKDVRKDLKEAVKGNYLPSAYGYYVKTDSYTGGQSLTVRVTGVNEGEINTNDLKNRIRTIADAYNASARYPQFDYFNDTYLSRVEIESSREAQDRKQRAAASREAAKTKKTHNEYVKRFQQNRDKEIEKINLKPIPGRTLETGKVKNTDLWLVRRKLSSGEVKDYLFDFSKYDVKDDDAKAQYLVNRYMYKSKAFMNRNLLK